MSFQNSHDLQGQTSLAACPPEQQGPAARTPARAVWRYGPANVTPRPTTCQPRTRPTARSARCWALSPETVRKFMHAATAEQVITGPAPALQQARPLRPLAAAVLEPGLHRRRPTARRDPGPGLLRQRAISAPLPAAAARHARRGPEDFLHLVKPFLLDIKAGDEERSAAATASGR